MSAKLLFIYSAPSFTCFFMTLNFYNAKKDTQLGDKLHICRVWNFFLSVLVIVRICKLLVQCNSPRDLPIYVNLLSVLYVFHRKDTYNELKNLKKKHI